MNLFHAIISRHRSVLLLLTAFAFLSACASTQTVSQNQASAYKEAMKGDIEKARNLIKGDTDSSLSAFLLACFALSEGKLTLAKQYADDFTESEPYLADGKVLQELIEQRKAYPAEPWTVSYASAWKAAGSPQMTISSASFFEQSCEQEKKCVPREIPPSVKGKPEEMLLAIDWDMACDKAKYMELCLSQSSPDTPMSIKLLVLRCIDLHFGDDDTTLSPDLRNRAKAHKRDLIRELSAELPLYMIFPISSVLYETRDREEFSSAEIDRIEEAVSRPHIYPSRLERYNDYLERFIALGDENPYLSANSQLIMSDGPSWYSWGLRRKILKTAEKGSAEVRERLAKVLEKLGKAQAKYGSVLELILSTTTLHAAEEIRGNKIAQGQLEPIRMFSSKLASVGYDTFPAFFWPIRPLMIDALQMIAKDEIAFHQLFTAIDTPAELLKILKD